MRRTIMLALLLVAGGLGNRIAAQIPLFEIATHLDARLGFVRLRGPYDVNPDINADGFSADANWKYVDTTGIFTHFVLNLGPHFNVIRKDKINLGLSLTGGIGYAYGLKAADGLDGLVFTYSPSAHLSYNLRDEKRLGLALGYRYMYTSLPYHATYAGFEYIWANKSLQLQGMILPYNYWGLKTNGELFKEISVSDITLVYTIYLRFRR